MPPRAPLVTVVIPTFNRLPLLRESLASVAAQTLQDWEAVVVDDGSTDDPAPVVQALGDPRVGLIRRPHSGHLGNLRNAGAAEGTGDLIAFLDADDLWSRDKLARQVAEMRQRGAGWSYTGFEMMDAAHRPLAIKSGVYRALSGWIVHDVLGDRTGVMISTLMVSRPLFESLGGFNANPRLTNRGDVELTLRLAMAAEALGLPDILTRVREHADRTTATLSVPFERTAMVYDEFLALQLPTAVRRAARRVRARHLRNAAAQRRSRGHYGVAIRLLTRSVVDRALAAVPITAPRKASARAAGAPPRGRSSA